MLWVPICNMEMFQRHTVSLIIVKNDDLEFQVKDSGGGVSKEQINRNFFTLPKIKTNNFTSIFDWNYQDSKIENYQSHQKINFEIAV